SARPGQRRPAGLPQAKWYTQGTLTTTGRSFTATSIQILQVWEGHILLFRDFADPRVLEEVIGERVREADAVPDVRGDTGSAPDPAPVSPGPGAAWRQSGLAGKTSGADVIPDGRV